MGMHDDSVVACSPHRPPEPDYRFTLANERTFLAWQRTALGLLAAAVAVLHFLPGHSAPAVPYLFGGSLGVLAILSSAGGLIRWRRNDEAIRNNRPLPSPHLLAAVTVVLTGLGLVAVLVALVMAA